MKQIISLMTLIFCVCSLFAQKQNDPVVEISYDAIKKRVYAKLTNTGWETIHVFNGTPGIPEYDGCSIAISEQKGKYNYVSETFPLLEFDAKANKNKEFVRRFDLEPQTSKIFSIGKIDVNYPHAKRLFVKVTLTIMREKNGLLRFEKEIIL